MRVPATGGPPEEILEEPATGEHNVKCPLIVRSPCVLAQRQGKDLTFYSLDPLRGKGCQLGSVEAAAHVNYDWAVSPDGSRLGVTFFGLGARIKVLTLSRQAWQEVSVDAAWGEFQSLAWTADGKSFYVSSWLPDSFSLLHVTLAGKVRLLLRNPQTQWVVNPMPSPDGKHLAFRAMTIDSNVWMIDNF